MEDKFFIVEFTGFECCSSEDNDCCEVRLKLLKLLKIDQVMAMIDT